MKLRGFGHEGEAFSALQSTSTELSEKANDPSEVAGWEQGCSSARPD